MNHYFTNNSNIKSDVREYKVSILEDTFTFFTDNGVFSKEHLDFGSRLLIESFIDNGIEGDLLDLGSGIGVISIILSKKYKRHVTMIEVNERAASLSKINASKNGVDALIINKSIEDGHDGNYAYVVTNPPIRAGKKIVYKFFEVAYNCLADQGELWVVMRKQHGAESAIKEIESLFLNSVIVKKKNGFFIIKAIKNAK